MTQTSIAPTQSQWASAMTHLEQREEWRFLRISGIRYVSLVSGRSNRVYLARADADGCSCPFYVQTGRQCSHMLAIYLATTEDELREAAEEAAAVREVEIELAFAETATRLRGNQAGAALTYWDIWTED